MFVAIYSFFRWEKSRDVNLNIVALFQNSGVVGVEKRVNIIS